MVLTKTDNKSKIVRSRWGIPTFFEAMVNKTARTEFAQAIKAICMEKGLDTNVVLEAIKQAVAAAYRRDARERGEIVGEDLGIDVQIDSSTGETKVFVKGEDVTPPGFGRIAAQTAKQVIHQKIREAEKNMVMREFENKEGGLVSGVVLRFEGKDVRVDLGKAEGILPNEERIPTERLNIGERLTFLLKDIKEGTRGKEIILSRADPQFIVALFTREVPEIASGSVEIKSIVREAGVRTKMLVSSNQRGVDPVGSCVGQKGVRVQTVMEELDGERVDVIPYSDDVEEVIKSALVPAGNLKVRLNKKEKTAYVEAPEDQLPLAIGKDGQNARLVAKLTGWSIKVGKEEVLSKKDEKVDENSLEGKKSNDGKLATEK